jgi:hypothetical protein
MPQLPGAAVKTILYSYVSMEILRLFVVITFAFPSGPYSFVVSCFALVPAMNINWLPFQI